MPLYAIILAAGKGKRMAGDLPKVLVPVGGKPMVYHVIEASQQAGAEKIMLVVGYKGEHVREKTKHYHVNYVWQEQQLGTGHAIKIAKTWLENLDGDILVLYGDTPLITADTILQMYETYKKSKSVASVLTTKVLNPFGYGRIIRGKDGGLKKIVEEKEATQQEKKVKEINSGMYIFKSQVLVDAVEKISADNIKQEYYLTDVISVLVEEGRKVIVFFTDRVTEVLGANTQDQLRALQKVYRATSSVSRKS